ncbi:hypothetical protein B0T22DRAFT_522568 [Podospora appendiculata]|uniref:Uncharacterized protein n=1 Tax=Podospora appendiculata TaxID=314037 RepID=A0AAE1C8M8_9PEZI|nr:hypothetical protein B0T22DRAFT_522568 [Podospora appendiculata]
MQSIAETEVTSLRHCRSCGTSELATAYSSDDTDSDWSFPDSGDDESHLEEMGNIQTILQELARISMAVRKSSSKYRFQKADASLREEDYDELKSHLTCLMLIPSSGLFGKGLDVGSETRFNPERLTSLQRRLIHANIVRRNRIHYATRNTPPPSKIGSRLEPHEAATRKKPFSLPNFFEGWHSPRLSSMPRAK